MKCLSMILLALFLVACGQGAVGTAEQGADSNAIFGLEKYFNQWVYPFYPDKMANQDEIESLNLQHACHKSCQQEFRNWKMRWGAVVIRALSADESWMTSMFLPVNQCGKIFIYTEAATQEECEAVFADLPTCEWVTYVPECNLESNKKWWLTKSTEVFVLPAMCVAPVFSSGFTMQDYSTQQECETEQNRFRSDFESEKKINDICKDDKVECSVCHYEGESCGGTDLCCPGTICTFDQTTFSTRCVLQDQDPASN